jgi:RimJ/RimL family protein N-acetyltransferase
MNSVNRLPVSPGASARVLTGAPSAAVVAAGPPPAPSLIAPWSVRAVEPAGDELVRVVGWMGQPHVAEWWHQDWSEKEWSAEVARQRAGDHSRPWTVCLEQEPVAYLEVYRVARDVLARHLDAGPHDLGVHLAVGDRARTGRGLGRALLGAVADGLVAADPACRRVVGDPAAGHHRARRAFAGAGFVLMAEVDLPHKRAALMTRSARVDAGGSGPAGGVHV